MTVQIQLRGDTAANWTSVDPTLAAREVGLETDTRLFKIGDGSTSWTGLDYAGTIGTTPAVVLGGSAAAGSAPTFLRSDDTIKAFDSTSPSTQAIGDSAATGSAAYAARRDHKHAITNPLTTQDDLWVGGSSGAPGRLAKGSDGQVLTVDPTTHHLIWATPSGGGGGGSVTVQYPGLKPATPTYDFAGASLPGAFSAHSSQGSFGTGNCSVQGELWMGSALELHFSEQMGALYVTHADTDLDFSVGGVSAHGMGYAGLGGTAFGIAALNSSGTGVGLLADMSGSLYSSTITTWGADTLKTNWTNHGFSGGNRSVHVGDVWFRLTRVSGTWTYYASFSGRAWDKVYSTSADSVTVDRIAFGLFYDPTQTYSGRLVADYFQVDV
jgi:hypothetical protein